MVLPLTDKHKLRVTENRVVRGIFGSTTEEVTGGGAKLHKQERHNLYCSSNITD